MPITPPPPAPNRSQPATFSSRMDAFLGWLVDFVPQLNRALSVIDANGYATTGGNANTIVLTAGYPELVIGLRVRFKANVQNTGPATINLDGFGARQCRTMKGTVLPSGYIRSDVETQATFDGTYWVLDREVETGSNVNGRFVKHADGRLEVYHAFTAVNVSTNVAAGALFRTDPITWEYPHAFIAGLAPVPHIACASVQRWTTLGATVTETQATYVIYGVFNYTGSTPIRASAFGRWY